jgi:hypothetical protein
MRLLHLVGAAIASVGALAGCGNGGGPAADGGGRDGGGGPPPASGRIELYNRSDEARRLVLETDSVPGEEPPAAVQRRVEGGFATLLDKPDGIAFVLDGALESRGADHRWSDDQLRSLARDSFDLEAAATEVTMHLLFVDGRYHASGSEGVVLGVALDDTHLVIFSAEVESACGGAGPLLRDRLCESLLSTVLIHEIGHVIGLVNRGLPMVADHEDGAHPRHDVSQDCVMYFAAESDRIVDLLIARITGGETAPLGFDAACQADIAALRDR